MLVRLREHDQIDWSRASIDGSTVASPPGGQETGPNPTDRGKLGSKRHIIVDARGIPLVVLVSGANRHDSKMFEPCVDALPAVAGLQGHPRKRPAKLHADKGYDYKRCRAHLRQRGHLKPNCQTRHRKQRTAGQASLGGAENARIVCWLWQVANPL